MIKRIRKKLKPKRVKLLAVPAAEAEGLAAGTIVMEHLR